MSGPRAAIVTGGGTGIGRATSLELAARGFAVGVGYSRSAAEAEAVVAEITASGGRALALQADVADDAAVRAVTARVHDELGVVAALVNNAGGTEHLNMRDLDGATDEVFERLFRLNVLGAWHCSRAAATDLRSCGGAIVNIGSIAGSTGVGSSLPYAVSKSALHGLTRSMAHALAPEVRVNCVAPGMVRTRWWAGQEERAEALGGTTLLGRLTEPEDVARVVVDILAARAMTGQIVTVDGGQTL